MLMFCRFAIVFVLLLVCTGNITNSVLLKYGFQDARRLDGTTQAVTLIGMMEGTAPQPFAYRANAAILARRFADQLSPPVRDRVFATVSRHDALHSSYFSTVSDAAWTPVVALTFHLIYALFVASTLGALWVVFRLARLHGYSFGASLGVLLGFSIVYPLTCQHGANYYDAFELAGAFAACYCVLRRAMLGATLIIGVLSLNKETFFLVPLALWFLQPAESPSRTRLAWLALQTASALLCRAVITHGAGMRAPRWVDTHLVANFGFWLDPLSYVRFCDVIGAGIFTPSLQNPLFLAPAALFFADCWRRTGPCYRRYFVAALAPLLVLLLVFGEQDETRNLSLALPAFVLIALAGARRFSSIFAPAEGRMRCPSARRRLRTMGALRGVPRALTPANTPFGIVCAYPHSRRSRHHHVFRFDARHHHVAHGCCRPRRLCHRH